MVEMRLIGAIGNYNGEPLRLNFNLNNFFERNKIQSCFRGCTYFTTTTPEPPPPLAFIHASRAFRPRLCLRCACRHIDTRHTHTNSGTIDPLYPPHNYCRPLRLLFSPAKLSDDSILSYCLVPRRNQLVDSSLHT